LTRRLTAPVGAVPAAQSAFAGRRLRLAGLTRGDFAAGKRQAARFFFAHELPRVMPLLELLEARDRTVLDMHDDWF